MVTSTDPRIASLLAALNSGDAQQMQAICHPDLVIEDPAGLPYGGVYRGFEGLAEVAGRLLAIVSECRIETEQIFGDAASGEFVLRQRLTGRATASGRPVETSILEHYIFRDGLLVKIRPYYWDTKMFTELLTQA
jgi:uncharacterized protein